MSEYYADADPDVVASLQRFRTEHPPKGLRIDGHIWRYVSMGEGPRTLLFLHGMAGAYDIWWQQLEAFRGQFRVVSLTYPETASLAGLRRGVMAILEADGVESFAVVGSSLGGYLAQYLVAQEGDRIERAVFANTFPPNDIIGRENRVRSALARVLPWSVVKAAYRRSVTDEIAPAAGGSALVKAYLLEQVDLMTKAQLLARYRCVVDRFEPVEPSMPVLIIESDNDPLVSRELREMLIRTYPHARRHTFHKTGHFTYLNEPAEYTRVLAGFLDGD